MSIIAWIVLGLIAGAIAKALMPGKDPGGMIVTMLIGIVGAFLGGFLGNMITGSGLNGFSLWSILLAVVGAMLLLWIYRMTTRGTGGRTAVTHYEVRERIESPYGKFALIDVRIGGGDHGLHREASRRAAGVARGRAIGCGARGVIAVCDRRQRAAMAKRKDAGGDVSAVASDPVRSWHP